MKFALALFLGNLASIVCFVSAAYLAVKDKPGWGWFLFVGLLCVRAIESK